SGLRGDIGPRLLGRGLLLIGRSSIGQPRNAQGRTARNRTVLGLCARNHGQAQEQERCRKTMPSLVSDRHLASVPVSNRRAFPSPAMIIQASLSRTTLAEPSTIVGCANLLAGILQVS